MASRDARVESALREACDLLEGIDPSLRAGFAGPVLSHLLGRPGALASSATATTGTTRAASESPKDFAEFYHYCNADSEPERALVAAYWGQEFELVNPFESQAVNDALKRLGYPISNITRALGDLAGGRPQLIMQIEKSGRTKQARKKYRVTDAGIRTVNHMRELGDTNG